ncbi:hypothetical protein ACVWYH_005078 [Bradyrhizobium sp. GM24.11]
MPAATAYVLHVPEGRRDIILSYAEEDRHDATRYVAEPVPSFSYGSNTLVVLACFRDGAMPPTSPVEMPSLHFDDECRPGQFPRL